MVEPAHQSLSPRLCIDARIFLVEPTLFFQLRRPTDDSEMPVVISSISRIGRFSLSEVLIGLNVSVHAFVNVYICIVFRTKRKIIKTSYFEQPVSLTLCMEHASFSCASHRCGNWIRRATRYLEY